MQTPLKQVFLQFLGEVFILSKMKVNAMKVNYSQVGTVAKKVTN